jgi:queuine tRNA-ribosyltransferase
MPMEPGTPAARGVPTLQLPHGALQLPAFLPDATHAVVRYLDAADLEACGTQGLVMNTFHLMQRPGSSTIKGLGGLHRFSGWQGPIITDSGGFQAYSLIRNQPKQGSLTDQGLSFRQQGSNHKYQLTPAKAIQLQLSYRSDVVICLDDCTNVEDSAEVQERAVKRTLDWARRSKREFDHLVEQTRLEEGQRPLLMAVVQGGGSRDLRRRCAEGLLDIGFGAFGFGGWPLDAKGNLLLDIIAYVRELIPAAMPLHALGVGHPRQVVQCARIGYTLFDSTMPTRDARHGRLYTFLGDPATAPLDGEWFRFIYPGDDKHIKNEQPISTHCDCLACRRYSLAYLHHLFTLQEGAYQRLATMHNLRFMARLMEGLQDECSHLEPAVSRA